MRRTDLDAPGISRRRRGEGFSYHLPDGRLVSAEVRTRIGELVIPPAWTEVWISTDPDVHLLATGVDDAGRTQYLYHPQWRVERDAEKFERVTAMARRLPRFRRAVDADLGERRLSRARVIALVLWLLDTGALRIGSTAYEDEHGSHGATTLLVDHVRDRGDGVELEFPAKSGQTSTMLLHHPPTVRTLRALRRAGSHGDHLMRYRDGQGGTVEVSATMVADRFAALVGPDHTVKDLRTWAATVAAAEALAAAGPADDETGVDAAIRDAVQVAADSLGDTVSVARNSYVDPRLLSAYREGRTVTPPRRPGGEHSPAVRRRIERELAHLLSDTASPLEEAG
ncbi:DNA topoisomerase IB [Luteipulveratus sp. YIM 133132]|uniref:DNA topoisomerase IB n=1 Tax=Luteipulveratus flavus TaxID=3031728 RepID=UPI0023B1CC30|nr:DNA topoisomerase IB [Luteipulveratus sp. YIM 133132]MDE9365726.1 DNA topoisomerase IB [Luteipulveratus sp. YIM 133132]